MGALSRTTRKGQLAQTETDLKALVARLRSEGADDRAVGRHPRVRALRASAAQGRRRLKAIDDKEALNQKLADHKKARLEAKKSGGKKKGKKGADEKGKGKGKDKAKAKGAAPKDKAKAKGAAPKKDKKDKKDKGKK